MSAQVSPQNIIATPQDITTTSQDITKTPQDNNTTCSQDLFGDIDPLQSSKVCSSTPINSTHVVRVKCKHDTEQLVDDAIGDGSTSCLLNDVTEKDQLSTFSNCKPRSVNNTIIDNATCNYSNTTDQISNSLNSNPSSLHNINTMNNVQNHSNTGGEISSILIPNPDTIQTADNQFHNNSDLMDELFANNFAEISSATTGHHKDTVVQLTSAPGECANGHGSKGNDVINDDSGCGLTESDVITPSHASTDKLHMRTDLCPQNIRSFNATRKSAKQFRAPRLAKEVSKDEERMSLERLAKQFPSLAPSSTSATVPRETGPCPSSERVLCGFVAASGKKLSVSAAALDHAAKLCSNETDNTADNLAITDVIHGEFPPDLGAVPNKEHNETELTESYCVENMDSIDMDQFSAFTQMPGYVTKGSLEVSSVKGDTPSGRSALFTPGGSPPLYPEGADPSRSAHEHDEDSIHKMFNTQVVKQFLDFHSSDENDDDDDKTSEAATVPAAVATDKLTSKESSNLKPCDTYATTHPTHKDTAIRSHDPDRHTHKTSNGHNQMMLSGFTTAGGKSVMVSSEAVASVKKLLEDEDSGMMTGKGDAVDVKDGAIDVKDDAIDVRVNATPVRGSQGLSTASGKKVEISNQSLHVAQQLLREGEDDTVKSYQTPVVKFNGFCTAGGNVVKVSEESMKKAKKLLDGELTTGTPVPSISLCDSKQSGDVITPARGFPGLSTASGKKVEISSESLRVAQQLLREGDDNPVEVAKSYQTPVKFNGFCTAAGSAVKVSEESMKKAKKLLDEDLSHHDDPIPSIPLCDGNQPHTVNDVMDTTPANMDKVRSEINL